MLGLLAGAAVATLWVVGVLGMPQFGSNDHPYRDRAVAAAVEHATANVVSAVNYDQRALDTFGEETILLGSVVGAATLLRPTEQEHTDTVEHDGGPVLEAVALLGYVLLPVTLLIGADLVAHGHLTPGGGFQGGVVLGTAVHLLYLTGRLPTLEKARPVGLYRAGEAVGTTVFAATGLAGLAAGGGFLANVLPLGTFGTLLSSGTVPLLNVAVGVEVASGVVVLLARFLDQALRIRQDVP
ncbi:MAG: multicomponent Na+:H+ antiporter subunit [Pseudonocardiales bacterium]|jgi:multicomponent Na+:H+ antiporter subunit B|nr:multicomponent Na+:H+ antiporter subunit [Pseudonocardiales bacterium]